ncbi:MAG: RNA-binding protein, partial [Bacteroidetes bacterium]
MGCQDSSPATAPETGAPLFRLRLPAETGIDFVNRLQPSDTLNILEYNYYYNGGGIGAGDFNGDGEIDLFFSGNQVRSELFLGEGNLRFRAATTEAGLSTTGWVSGVSVVDINADGRLDLYLCRAGLPDPDRRRNLLFVNQGNDATGVPTFTEEAAAYGLDDPGYGTQAAFFDYDRDGDLDLYLLNAWHDKFNPNIPRPQKNDGSAPSLDRFFRNDGLVDGQPRFREVGQQVGIIHEGYGLGVKISDLNGDGWPDVFVGNDFVFDDRIYLNQRDGTFREVGHTALQHSSRFTMGCDIADVNRDGRPDLFTLDMLPEDNYRQKLMNTMMTWEQYELAVSRGYLPQFSRNHFQLHEGNGPDGIPRFAEIGFQAGIARTDWSWSAEFADLDLDGRLDLAITNGIPRDITDADFINYRYEETQGAFSYREVKQKLLQWVADMDEVRKPNVLFRQTADHSFEWMTGNWGADQPAFSHGALCLDLDGDGDLDWVTHNLEEAPFVWENQARQQHPERHYIHLQFQGEHANPGGFGAEVRLVAGGQPQYLRYEPVRGFQSAAATGLHVGLNTATRLDTLEVYWPDGRYQRWLDLPVDTTHRLSQATAGPPPAPSPAARPLLRPIGTPLWLHEENSFNDFRHEPLLAHMQARMGPALAIGDINGDQREDVFIGGAAGIAGQWLLQQADGRFLAQPMPDPDFEDAAAACFDADGDGDLDLYVASGGSEYNPGTAAYQDRLYRNDGTGQFTRDRAALPALFGSARCVRPSDIDGDGDLDLFVGGGAVPGQYPASTGSMLLRNEGSRFRLANRSWLPALDTLGIVSGAAWLDANGDGRPDLLVAGPWQAPQLWLQQAEGGFVAGDLPEDAGSGWWMSVTPADLDGDGDTDVVLGNLGENTRFSASTSEPLMLFSGDLDGNGQVDPILARYLPGKDGQRRLYPLATRSELLKQLPMLGRRFPSFASFAEAPVD